MNQAGCCSLRQLRWTQLLGLLLKKWQSRVGCGVLAMAVVSRSSKVMVNIFLSLLFIVLFLPNCPIVRLVGRWGWWFLKTLYPDCESSMWQSSCWSKCVQCHWLQQVAFSVTGQRHTKLSSLEIRALGAGLVAQVARLETGEQSQPEDVDISQGL